MSSLAFRSPVILDPEGAILNRGISLLLPVKVNHPSSETWPLSLIIDSKTLCFFRGPHPPPEGVAHYATESIGQPHLNPKQHA